MAPVGSHRAARARAEQAHILRVMGHPWSAIRDALGFQSIAGAQNAVRRHEGRTPPTTSEGARRSANEALGLLLAETFAMQGEARRAGDFATAATLVDRARGLIAERNKLFGAYIPQPTAEQSVNVTVSASPIAAVESWRQQMLGQAKPDRPPLPMIDVEPEPLVGGGR